MSQNALSLREVGGLPHGSVVVVQMAGEGTFLKLAPDQWHSPAMGFARDDSMVGGTLAVDGSAISAYSSQWPPATAPWPGMSDEEQASQISKEADEIVERLRESPELRYELLAREPALRSLIEAIAALAPASK